MEKYQVRLLEKVLIAKDTYEIFFSYPENFSFKAGQYVDLHLLSDTLPLRERHRSFSLSSSPRDMTKLSTAMRMTPSDFKTTLVSLPLGSALELSGPFGHFTVSENTKQPLIFLAGGIGITPFMSMLRSQIKNPVTLINANSSVDRQAFSQELTYIKQQLPDFTFHEKIRRITWEYITQKVAINQNILWYIAGPKQMVQDTKTMLSDHGIAKENILPEAFTGYETI